MNVKGPKFFRDAVAYLEDKIERSRPRGTPTCNVTNGPDGYLIDLVAHPSRRGVKLHNIDLADAIPDPFKIASQLLDSIIPTIDFVETGFIDALVDMFSAALNSEDTPDRADVLNLVNTFIGEPEVPLDQIPDLLADILGGMAASVSGALEAYFSTSSNYPADGDGIYAGPAGKVFEIWRQVDGFPASNSVWSVPFTIGEGEKAITYVAMIPGAVPDIGAMVSSSGMVIAHLLATLVDLLATLITDALMAMFEAIALIKPLIEELVEALRAALQAAIDALSSRVDDAESRLDDIEEILAAAVEVDVIDTAGHASTIKVLTASDGGEIYTTITWIDSTTGAGQSADFIFWNGPNDNVRDVDWRTFKWLGQDGSHKAAKLLSLNTGGYPKDEDDAGTLFSPETRDLCSADGSGSETKQLLLADES